MKKEDKHFKIGDFLGISHLLFCNKRSLAEYIEIKILKNNLISEINRYHSIEIIDTYKY